MEGRERYDPYFQKLSLLNFFELGILKLSLERKKLKGHYETQL